VKVPTTYVNDITCATACLGNTKESCGGSYQQADPAVSFYERADGGPADPKATEVYSAVVMTRTISQASPSSTRGATGGGGGGSGGVRTASSIGIATKSGATLTKSNAAGVLRVSEPLYSVGSFGTLSFLLGFLAAI
jgi:hypothetical protein